jgi:hypothetical protein
METVRESLRQKAESSAPRQVIQSSQFEFSVHLATQP